MYEMEGARVSEIPFDIRLKVGAGCLIRTVGAVGGRRVIATSLRVVMPNVALAAYDGNDVPSIVQAYTHRSLQPLPVVHQWVYTEFRAWMRRWVKRFGHTVAEEFEDWLEQTHYTLAEKNRLRNVWADMNFSLLPVDRFRHYTCFVKAEFYPARDQWKAPRMIHSPSDQAKVLFGPYFKACEKLLFGDDLESVPFHSPFVKHLTVDERKIAVDKLPVHGMFVYLLDQKSFEAHITSQFMGICECIFYRWVIGNTPLTRLICAVLTGRHFIHSRTGLTVVKRGRRNSGDMCTSLGNSITSYALLAFIINHRKHGEFWALIEGDDVLVSSTVPLVPQDFLELGFETEITPHSDPHLASFCGLVFGDSGQVVRDPIKFCLKFGWIFGYVGAGSYVLDSLLHGKALSALFETPHCPIVAPLARYALQLVRYTSPRWLVDAYHDHVLDFDIPDYAPTMDTRLLFAISMVLVCHCNFWRKLS